MILRDATGHHIAKLDCLGTESFLEEDAMQFDSFASTLLHLVRTIDAIPSPDTASKMSLPVVVPFSLLTLSSYSIMQKLSSTLQKY